MEGLEQQLGAILNNPQMMANLMQMAQNLSSANPPQPQAPPQPEAPQPGPAAQAGSFGDLPIDIGMLQRIGAGGNVAEEVAVFVANANADAGN